MSISLVLIFNDIGRWASCYVIRGADEHDILIALHKAQPGQFLDLATLHPLGKLIIEVGQRFVCREAGQARQDGLLSHVAARGFGLEQPFQEIAIGGFG